MKRGNPLFVDSTKFQGDQILTKLQARAPYVVDGSQFIAEVRRARGTGEAARIPLVFDNEDGLWRGQIHLEHLEPIQVRLILKAADEEEIPGPAIDAMGIHIVDLFWDRDEILPPFEIG